LRTLRLRVLLHSRDLGLGIGDEVVDRDHGRHAEALYILDVAAEVDEALPDGLDIFCAEVLALDTTVHLERAHGRDDDRRRRIESGLAALDVEELLCTEISAETGFCDDVIGELQRGFRRHDRVAAMRNVREWATVYE